MSVRSIQPVPKIKNKERKQMKRKWTRASAEAYIGRAKEKGLTYWSAYDYLKNHGGKENK